MRDQPVPAHAVRRESVSATHAEQPKGAGAASGLDARDDTSSAITLAAADRRGDRGSLPTAADVTRALRDGELEVWFQPKIEIATGEVVGSEGLLRWCV